MRRTSMKLFAMCGLAAGLVACGDDDNNTPNDTSPSDTTDTSDTTPDTTDTVEPDTDTDTTPDSTDTTDTTGPTCNRTGFNAVSSFFEYDEEYDFTNFGAESNDAYFIVEFYDIGAGSPITGPGIYPIGATAADRNYETCSTCVRIGADCGAQSCAKTFFGTGGTIEVSAIDQAAGTITAKLKDLVAVEVTIDSQTFRSTPVPNGETYCIASVDVDFNPECTSDAQCTDTNKPFCDTEAQVCVQCLSFFDCPTTEAPVCLFSTGTCGTQTGVCTGDDTLEPNNGPAQATALTPGEINAKLCVGTTDREFDWYKFTLAEVSNLEFTVTHAAATAMDFDIIVFDDAGELVDIAESENNPEVLSIPLVPAGNYYALVYLYSGSNTAAIDYTFKFATTVPECFTNTDCTEAGEPICDTSIGACVVCASSFDCAAATPICLEDEGGVRSCTVVDVCTGDDTTRENNDDGPNGASDIVFGTPINSKICGEIDTPSELESDFFLLDVTAAGTATITLTWAGDSDLDVYLYKEDGTFVDGSVEDSPEVIATAVTAGKYYIEVVSYEGNPVAAIDYTLEATFAAAP